jgi:hypothetical protein
MNDVRRKSPKRLTLNIPEDYHKELKIRSVMRNITLTEWVLRAIREAIAKEQQYE